MSTPNDDNASISEKKEDTPSMSKDPAEPKNSTRVEFVLTPEERKREWIQIAALSWALFFVGWVDGTTGPLLPSFQRYWHVNDTVVSLLFILNCVGILCGVAFLIRYTAGLGFGKLIVAGSVVNCIALAIQASRPPFPVMVVAYFINGFGLALLDAQANGFTAALREQASLKMGIIHSTYGLGALVSPLVATQFASRRNWNFHFLASLGVAIIDTIVLVVVFKFQQQQDLTAQYHHNEGPSKEEGSTEGKSVISELFRTRNVYLLAIFCLIYVGVEVTIGGWIVTYIIRERGGGTSSGYVSSGYFGGITAGRILLLPVNRILGEYNVVFIYSAICLGLEIIVWRAKSLVGNAIAVSFIGFFLGPMYPIMISHGGRILPRRILTLAVGCIGAMGASGSALFPFITGALASRFGIIAMQPLLIILIGVMSLLWSLTPRKPRAAAVEHGA